MARFKTKSIVIKKSFFYTKLYSYTNWYIGSTGRVCAAISGYRKKRVLIFVVVRNENRFFQI